MTIKKGQCPVNLPLKQKNLMISMCTSMRDFRTSVGCQCRQLMTLATGRPCSCGIRLIIRQRHGSFLVISSFKTSDKKTRGFEVGFKSSAKFSTLISISLLRSYFLTLNLFLSFRISCCHSHNEHATNVCMAIK